MIKVSKTDWTEENFNYLETATVSKSNINWKS